jgi:hypothetical protein
MIKKILLSLGTVFLIWQSYGLIMTVPHMSFDSWLSSIFIAWLLNLFITGVFALSGFAFPTQNLLPNSYYHVHHPEKLKGVCKVFQVELFRFLLLATLWRSKRQRKTHFNGKKDGIAQLIRQSKKSEFGHLIPLVLLVFLSAYLCFIDLWKLAALTFIINVIGNFYPILLQRHHRMRIQALGIGN